MLYVTRVQDGVDTGEIISSVNMELVDNEKGAMVRIEANVHEDDESLLNQSISAVFAWGDGSAPVSYPKTSGGLLQVSEAKFLRPGFYVVVLRVQNYRSPREESKQVNFFVTVTSPVPIQRPQNFLFGPILPRDSGFPNQSQWEFNMNYDMYIIESSVKMLLLTAKGDRVMEPHYGTNIRRILFESNLTGVDSLIAEEIAAAFAVWEPRVTLANVTVNRDPDGRNVTLNMLLVSKLNRQPFETSLAFVQ